VPGTVFGPEGEGHLRFSFSVSDEMIAGGVEALTAFASATSGR
jgi:aspartate/methionine/tyrosine aminotransferase